jgi:dephospho-CoA kinase
MCAEAEPVPDSLQLPQSKLKLAIVGKPFAGKKSLAKIIADYYNLQVLDVADIYQSALK